MLSHLQLDHQVLSRIDARIAHEHEEKLWRPTAVALIESPVGNVLLARSSKDGGGWGLIQGGVHAGESIVMGLFRETRQEARVLASAARACRFCYTTRARMSHCPDGFALGKSYYFFHVMCRTLPEVRLRIAEVNAHAWLQPQAVGDFLVGRASPQKVQATLVAMRRAGLA